MTPTAWELRFGAHRLVLTHHIANPGRWVLICQPDFTHLDFADTDWDIDAVKADAVQLVARALRSAVAELEAI
jgi:hypothetical protein